MANIEKVGDLYSVEVAGFFYTDRNLEGILEDIEFALGEYINAKKLIEEALRG